MIEFINISKSYGKKQALKDLSLSIRQGEIFGFLGHNGAGKSTTIKSLVSIIEPSSGTILVDGMKLTENRLSIKQKIGYVPDSPDIFLQLTAGEYWDLISAAYELDTQKKEKRLAELTALFDMYSHQNETIASFSHGMRQKTILIGTLLPDPDIWVLDEPLQGLDPQAAFDLKEMMKAHAAKGKTVIFSTHVLDTAQQLCDKLAILKKGELIYQGAVSELLNGSPDETLEKIYLKMAGRQATGAMFAMNFVKLPGFFTYYVALFGMLGLTQSISVIYNIFFEGNDLQVFLPLPFGQGQVFSAKILVVALTIIPFVFPLLVMFILTGWRADLGILLTIIISILLFSLFLIILFCLASLIVFGLARTAVFKKHRKTVSSILLGSSMLIAFAGIMWMNHQTGTIENELTDRHPISILLPFYDAASQPLSQQGLLGWGILAITALGFFLAVKQLIVPKLTEQLTDSNSEFKIKRTHKKNQNVHQLLFSYNAQLVKEPNLIMQVLSSSLLTPIIFILAFALGGEIKLTDLDNKLIGVVFLVGIALAFLTVNQTSFISNLISLDQENFLFIRSLPISMNQYLKEKFRFGWILQSFLTGGIALLSGLSFRLPLFFIPSLLFGSLFGCYLLSLRYFARDYRLLLLNWTNINQLFNRGSGSLGLVATMMGSLIISIILIVLYGMLALFYPFWLVNIPVIGLVLILSALWIVYYQRTFWKKFE